jgi:transposase-like protein
MLNERLDAEPDRLCGATRYERNAERRETRAGYYERTLNTRASEVKLKVPKLCKLPFETAIIERYRRREASVEESLIEMYLAGVSVRRIVARPSDFDRVVAARTSATARAMDVHAQYRQLVSANHA